MGRRQIFHARLQIVAAIEGGHRNEGAMTRKSENIVRHSEAELRRLRDSDDSGSDWMRAARQPVPAGKNPDDALEAIDWATTELPSPRRKRHTNLRIDADVLDYFRGQGRGYQTRINAVLRAYVEHMRAPQPK